MMREYYLLIITLFAISIITATKHDDLKIPTHCPAKDHIHTIRLKHEHDCTKFYKCLRGEKILMICPYRDEYSNRLHFNPKLQICDWPDPKICNQSDISLKNPNVCPPGLKKCIRIRGPDCDKFYLCDHGREVLMECAKGLHFNPIIQMCDYPKNAGCKDTCHWKCCPPKHSPIKVYLPHECACEKYYECVKGEEILRKCQKDKYFNSRLMKCMDPEDADCVVRPTVPPTDALLKCPESDVGYTVKVPHEHNCNQYFECIKGEMILRECSDDLSFNPHLAVCDSQENIPCNVSACCKDFVEPLPIPSDTDYDISVLPAPVQDPDCPTGGTIKLPHLRNCSLYYICEDGKKTLHVCSWGLHFNPITKQCDWPSSVKCNPQLDLLSEPVAYTDKGNAKETARISESPSRSRKSIAESLATES